MNNYTPQQAQRFVFILQRTEFCGFFTVQMSDLNVLSIQSWVAHGYVSSHDMIYDNKEVGRK